MAYLEIKETDFGFFEVEAMKDKGLELAEKYNLAQPFPHSIIDDFLPEAVLELCLEHFPKNMDPDSKTFNRDQQRFKTSYNPDYVSPQARSLFYSFNSRPFLLFLENVTGIKGLIPDPYFIGGGFHGIDQGGHLSVHADFNHHKILDLERRINVLIYLNKDWSDDFGGQIELWDEDMQSCVVSATPEFNRCVIFNTTEESYHGNPQPINHPKEVTRKSIALYYYTATWDGTTRDHTTQYRSRPGSADRTNWMVLRTELMNELLPPILVRFLRRVGRKIGI